MKIKLKETSESSNWVSHGKIYDVFELSFELESGSKSIRFISEEDIPIIENLDLFDIVDFRIPEDWVISSSNSTFTITYKTISEKGFWEAYFENEPSAVSSFEQLKNSLTLS